MSPSFVRRHWRLLLCSSLVLFVCGTIVYQALTAPRHSPAVQAQIRQTMARFAEEDRLRAKENARQAEKESRAREACMAYTRQAARHPSTVAFNPWRTVMAKEANNRLGVRLIFTAKNSFGLALQHEIFCLVEQDRVIHATMTET